MQEIIQSIGLLCEATLKAGATYEQLDYLFRKAGVIMMPNVGPRLAVFDVAKIPLISLEEFCKDLNTLHRTLTK